MADAEFEAFAALLRRGRDVPEMVRGLAEHLERALPDHVDVSRRGLRRRVHELTVQFDPERFRIRLHGHRAMSLVDHVVRGVCVRTEETSFDDWLDRLATALTDAAKESTEVRLALEKELG